MPGCVALNCTNSSQKGFLMKRFPKDPARRNEWFVLTKRPDWTPTNYSCLCEVHFGPEMWEKTREDGSRKLKGNAVPTIFSFSQPIKSRNSRVMTPEKVEPSTSEAMSPVLEIKLEHPELIIDDDQETRSSPSIGESEHGISLLPHIVIENTQSPEPNATLEIKLERPELIVDDDQETHSSTSSGMSEHGISLLPHNPHIVIEDKQSPELNARLDKYDKIYLKEKAARYKRLLRNANKRLKTIEKRADPKIDQYPLLNLVFNQDQILALSKKHQNKSTKLMKWSNETVMKSLKLKFLCGNNGYNELLKQDFPLPCVRTLHRRLQNITFGSGILHEVLEFLKIKVEAFQSHERDCVLILTEMAITPENVIDGGEVTLPEHTGPATHVLVFMLAGVNTRWKQVVAYYFTSDSVKGDVLKNIIEDLFRKVEDLNLNILSVTSNMGACEQALWKIWGIAANKDSKVVCKIRHPLHSYKFVYVFADTRHLFKNIKSMLIGNKIITLPNYVVEKYALPTNEILASHISEVVKLSEEDLLRTNFAEINASYSVSSDLKFLAEELDKPGYLTTAWFLDQVEKWFYLMTSHHPSSTLSKFNMESYTEVITFLETFMNLFKSMEVGYEKIWTPSQTAVIVSTQSMLKLQKFLFETRNYKFILTSRFSQGFEVLRSKQIVPNAVQVKNNLKLVCVSQYLKNVSACSYDEGDSREHFSDF